MYRRAHANPWLGKSVLMIRSCQKRPGAHQPRRWEQNGGYNGNVANRLVCLGGCDPVLVPAHQAWPGVFTYAEPTNRTSGSRLHKDLNSIVERVGNAPVKPPDHRLTLRHYQGGEWQQHSRIFKHTNCTIGAPTPLDTTSKPSCLLQRRRGRSLQRHGRADSPHRWNRRSLHPGQRNWVMAYP